MASARQCSVRKNPFVRHDNTLLISPRTMSVDFQRIRGHLAFLAKSPRPAGSAPLNQARDYVAHHFESAGWTIERYRFTAVDERGASLAGENIIARRSETEFADPDLPVLCVGAHVDSRPDSPGADDNASAVATLLEIARLLPTDWPERPQLRIELAGFDLEENGMLGGAEHARRCRVDGVNLAGLISLEMLGYCNHSPNSQQLPRTLQGMYPTTGNFIAVVGNQRSQALIDGTAAGLRMSPELPVETLAVAGDGELLQASRLSDHSPFWDAGYAALMITDTSFLRNPYYHTPQDTPETLDDEFLHKVAAGCYHAVKHLIASGVHAR